MAESHSKYFLTTPIYYVNARPHIGHAYTTIVADVLARRSRAQGVDTFFLTGTDEHGQKIERSAQAAGIEPQQFADQVSEKFQSLWDRMGLTYDKFIRTTSPEHKRGVQKLFSTLYERGFIYLSKYTGSYCVSDEAFVDLPAGTPCPDCGRPLETVTEENFFFKLSEFQLPLLDLIESNALLIEPATARNEVLSFLRGNPASGATPGAPGLDSETWDRPATNSTTAAGTPYLPGALKDLSISRSSFTWGVPVPEPAASTAAQKHVIYVWLDALANYMTALGYGVDTPEGEAGWEHYWPADLHLVGKEITRFHCVYWPAFLMAAGIATPRRITANGWLLFDNSKMSKSKGNVVRTETILDAFGTLCPEPDLPPALPFRSEALPSRSEPFPFRSKADESAFASTPTDADLFAADILRYYLLREIPFGQDGSFTFEALITRYNADLANGYGNLVSRTLTLINKSSEGIVDDAPEAHTLFHWEEGMGEMIGASESQLLGWKATELIQKIGGPFERLAFAEAIELISAFLRSVDQFLTSRKPWAATDTDISQLGRRSTLYTAAESIRIITLLLYPILPYATAKVWSQLGLDPSLLTTNNGQRSTEWGGLKPGTKLGPLGPIFPRADKGLAQIMSDMESPKPIECVTSPGDPAAAQKTTLGNVTDQNDAGHPAHSDFKTTSLASEANQPEPPTHDPAAGPRTATLPPEPNPGAHVAGSAAPTTERPGTPSHTQAAASGIFAGQPTDASPQITIDDFAKVELRVAQVLVCERIPKADKLLRLEVDLGYEKRQILSGIAEWYTPEELIGRRIVVITNLAPRKMRGLESHGMLLAASTEGGKPHLATFADAETLPLGSRLK